MLKKLLSELPMIGLGTGFALAGASAAAIGARYVTKSNFYLSSAVMAGGAYMTHVGSQVAIGAVERVRGLR